MLQQLPLSDALDYVDRHPEYFIASAEDGVVRSELPRGADAELDRHLAGDWVARQIEGEFGNVDDDRISWARLSVELTRETLTSSRSFDTYMIADDCVCDRGFSDAAFARLVRGFTNCDGMNHALAMLLARREPDTRLYHLDLGSNGDSPDGGHTLAVMPSEHEPIFVDAWADFGVMVLSSWGLLAHGVGPQRSGLFARAEYEDPRRVRSVDIDYGGRQGPGPDLTIPSDLPPITDARSAYLRARVFDLYGLEREAAELYEQAAELSCVIPTAALCQLSSIFLARARPGLDTAGYAG